MLTSTKELLCFFVGPRSPSFRVRKEWQTGLKGSRTRCTTQMPKRTVFFFPRFCTSDDGQGVTAPIFLACSTFLGLVSTAAAALPEFSKNTSPSSAEARGDVAELGELEYLGVKLPQLSPPSLPRLCSSLSFLKEIG